MIHAAVYDSSNIVTEPLFNRDWDSVPFLIDLSLTTDGVKTVSVIECYLQKIMCQNAFKVN